jgi:hypothetical protein
MNTDTYMKVAVFVVEVFDVSFIKTKLEGRMPSSGILRRVALVRTDVLEELSASIIRSTRMGELGTTPVLIRATRCHIPEEDIFHS